MSVMARLPRLFAPDVPAHITVRGNDRQDIFRCDADRYFFRSTLKEACVQHGVVLHSYVFMTNHVHLLGTGATASSVPKAMQCIGRRYVGYFNSRHGRTGTLWEGRYRATLVDTDCYLLACQRYIDMNPVRAGLVAHPSEYAWSSYHHYATAIEDPLVITHSTVLALAQSAERRALAYRRLFATPLDAEMLHRIRHASNHGWALGSDEFCRRLEREGARRTRPISAGYPCGRPRTKLKS
jgi:putative transposase